MVHACHLSYVGSINRRVEVQTGVGINVSPYLKNNLIRKVHGMAYVVKAWPTSLRP
jgi:hypothetical protein